MLQTPELVCPAGNLPALKAAIDNGADAVYMGLKDATNARNFPGLNFDMNSAQKLVLKMEHLTEKDEKEFADSILQVVMKENKNLFQKAKGVASMCEALKELMAPELKQAKQEAQNKGRQEGIQEGIQEGMQAGIHMLANTILRLRNGDSEEMILASGVDKSTLALALTLK